MLSWGYQGQYLPLFLAHEYLENSLSQFYTIAHISRQYCSAYKYLTYFILLFHEHQVLLKNISSSQFLCKSTTYYTTAETSEVQCVYFTCRVDYTACIHVSSINTCIANHLICIGCRWIKR